MVSKQLRDAWRFFVANAGYCTPPGRAACALKLARDEQWAQEEGITFEWVADELPWDGDCPAPEEILGCMATLGDETASLWGIGDPTPEYRRVIEAELASELSVDFFDALASHIRQL